MLSPLQNTFRPLATTNTYNPTNSEGVSTSLPDDPSHSYAFVPAASILPSLGSNKSPRSSTLGKPSAELALPKELSLYRSQNVIGKDNHKQKSVIRRTGTTDHSVFYHVSSHLDHLKASLAEKINEVFPFGAELGLTSSIDSAPPLRSH
ncbi:hypothetical protein RMATCC62417_09593 [Rhizopus microsporus]|nr:hypothetical protein RMATCC62417_09593 [Rhizopus microsporus]